MFILDPARETYLKAINSHIRRKANVLVTANHGSGKSELLRQIKNSQSTLRVRSLGSLYQLLGRIANVKEPEPRHKAKYLDYRCEHPCTVIIDEAQHLPDAIWPYVKIMMDAGNSFIFAARPDLHDTLKDRHPDVLSRVKHLKLEPLAEADMYKLVQADFDEDAFSVIYGSTYDMRVMVNHIDNCRDYAVEHKLEKVSIDIVMQFVGE